MLFLGWLELNIPVIYTQEYIAVKNLLKNYLHKLFK